MSRREASLLELLRRYARERSPVVVTGVVSAVLFCAGVRVEAADPLLALRGLVTAFLLLFLLRLSDDLCDVELDRSTHPERLLCLESTDLAAVRRFRALAVVAALLLQTSRWPAAAAVAAALALFAAFFALKHRLPALGQVVVLNGALAVFPVYAALLLHGEAGAPALLLGAFFWLGGIGHDLSHCLLDLDETPPDATPPINRVGQRLLAWLSLAAFLAAAAVGGALVANHWVGAGFAGALALTTAAMLALEVRLLRAPGARTAKPFYVFGFAFFLLPALVETLAAVARG